MQWNDRLWQQSQQYLSQFMIPLVEGLGRSERRVAATRSLAREPRICFGTESTAQPKKNTAGNYTCQNPQIIGHDAPYVVLGVEYGGF
jgi:hypothetical protein